MEHATIPVVVSGIDIGILSLCIDMAIAESAEYFLICRKTYMTIADKLLDPAFDTEGPIAFGHLDAATPLSIGMDRWRSKGYGEIKIYPMAGKTAETLLLEIMT